MYVVIMAGGSGTRLWPMSRSRQPKQFQALVSDQTLLQECYARVRQVAEPDEIFVSTTAELAALCQAQLPGLAVENVLVEPVGRNTGPAVGYATSFFHRVEPETVIATVHSDHVIGLPERFAEALCLARDTVTAQPELLFTIGLMPSWGNPGFGYIKAPGAATGGDALQVVEVARFEEKPPPEVAEQYYASGDYLWNAGYFVFRADTMMARLAALAPRLHAGLSRIQTALGTPHAGRVLEAEYRAFDQAPIDKLVFEPESEAGRVRTIPVELEWDDLGSWKTLRDVWLARDGGQLASRGEVVALDTANSLVLSAGGRLVAVIGLDDMVVVDTPDALLICRASEAERVRDVLAQLPPDDPRR